MLYLHINHDEFYNLGHRQRFCKYFTALVIPAKAGSFLVEEDEGSYRLK